MESDFLIFFENKSFKLKNRPKIIVSSRAVISYQKETRQRRRGCNLADVNRLIINYLHYDSLFRYDYLSVFKLIQLCFWNRKMKSCTHIFRTRSPNPTA
jgi:hypothetical protein